MRDIFNDSDVIAAVRMMVNHFGNTLSIHGQALPLRERPIGRPGRCRMLGFLPRYFFYQLFFCTECRTDVIIDFGNDQMVQNSGDIFFFHQKADYIIYLL